MLDELLPELKLIDVNRYDNTYQFIWRGKKSCASCPVAQSAHTASTADTLEH